MVPVLVLVTLPVTVMPLTEMQSIEPELLTELWLVRGLMTHAAASARGAPPATSSAATDDDTNRNRDRRATREGWSSQAARTRNHRLYRSNTSVAVVSRTACEPARCAARCCRSIRPSPSACPIFANNRCSAQPQHGANMVNQLLHSHSGCLLTSRNAPIVAGNLSELSHLFQ